MKEGKVSAVKVGNRTLIRTEALQAWLSARVAG